MGAGLSRRSFLAGSGVVALSALGIAGCAPKQSDAQDSAQSSTDALYERFGILDGEIAQSSVIVEEITDFSEEHEADVVVVGAGAAGVPAALAAVESGASVIVLQKQSEAISQGNGACGLNLEKSDEMGILRFLNKHNQECGWRSDWSLLKAFAEQSGEALAWVKKTLNDNGFETKEHPESYTFGDNGEFAVYADGMIAAANDAMKVLAKVAEQKGAEFFYETPGVQLICEDGRITGVVGKSKDGSYIRFAANKGVVLATGDYQNNDAMVARFCPDMLKFDKKQQQKTGDGILMGMLAGAVLEPVGHSKMVHDMNSGPMYNEPFLRVNLDGERFMNEEIGHEFENNVYRCLSETPGHFVQVFDDDYEQYVTEWGGKATAKDALLDYKYAGQKSDSIYSADTLEELATLVGVDPDALVKTVERYNELCESGVDKDYGKLPKYLRPIKSAPFYGIAKHVRLSAICSGLLIDENAQCLDIEGSPIPGLFSVGNNSGQFFGGPDYPRYAGGLSLGRCYTFGRIVGTYLAKA